jgi:hypothetical protein
MKKINLFIIIIVFSCLSQSCRHDQALFVNPNSPTNATAQTLLTAVEVFTFNNYESDIDRDGEILVQHVVGANGQAQQPQAYQLPEDNFTNVWGSLYQTLETAKLLKQNFGAKDPYYQGIADILMAMNWGLTTDCWGDIPFTEALQAEQNTFPHYDLQQTVYAGINSLLDSGITLLSDTAAKGLIPGADDVVFNGKLDNWIKTAYTLKARYLLRYSNKSNFNPTAILADLDKGINDPSQDCMATHGANSQEANQFYAFNQARTGYIVASNTLVDSMSLRANDQRLFYYFDSTGFGGVVGSPIDSTIQTASPIGIYLAAASNTPVPLVTYFEALFIKAEIEARNNDLGNAATDLNNAIKQNASKVTGGVYSGANIATYTASTASLNRVLYEKWIAMFGQPEAYVDYRRTKVPALTPNSLGATAPIIPQRYPTPTNERTSNPNAPAPAITLPVWFAAP